MSRNGHGQEKSEDRGRLSLARPSADGFLTGRPLVKEEDDSCDKWTIAAIVARPFAIHVTRCPSAFLPIPSRLRVSLSHPGSSTLQQLSTCCRRRNNELGFPNRNPSNWKYLCLGRIDNPAGLKQCCC